jgi:hypothetical protein
MEREEKKEDRVFDLLEEENLRLWRNLFEAKEIFESVSVSISGGLCGWNENEMWNSRLRFVDMLLKDWKIAKRLNQVEVETICGCWWEFWGIQ